MHSPRGYFTLLWRPCLTISISEVVRFHKMFGTPGENWEMSSMPKMVFYCCILRHLQRQLYKLPWNANWRPGRWPAIQPAPTSAPEGVTHIGPALTTKSNPTIQLPFSTFMPSLSFWPLPPDFFSCFLHLCCELPWFLELWWVRLLL